MTDDRVRCDEDCECGVDCPECDAECWHFQVVRDLNRDGWAYIRQVNREQGRLSFRIRMRWNDARWRARHVWLALRGKSCDELF